MKKTFIVLMMVLFTTMLIVSCDDNANDTTKTTYEVGDTGPAGGIIFYDVDADNDVQYQDYDGSTKTNKDGLISSGCGWRYLEAAPNDLDGTYIFGYYILSDTNTAVGTASGIGKGKKNTEDLVAKMGSGDTGNAYDKSSDGSKISNYAAKACDLYSTEVNVVTYDDWFLPTIYELNLMYENLHKHDPALGDFKTDDSYWSSEEYSGSATYAIPRWFDETHSIGGITKDTAKYVRPVRRFK